MQRVAVFTDLFFQLRVAIVLGLAGSDLVLGGGRVVRRLLKAGGRAVQNSRAERQLGQTGLAMKSPLEGLQASRTT